MIRSLRETGLFCVKKPIFTAAMQTELSQSRMCKSESASSVYNFKSNGNYV